MTVLLRRHLERKSILLILVAAVSVSVAVIMIGCGSDDKTSRKSGPSQYAELTRSLGTHHEPLRVPLTKLKSDSQLPESLASYARQVPYS
ncbi:MAG TPA: hypothetical protein EYG57_07780 [Planctomycetes bacterium]|nr:hypothetical protein [Planctomycetota bacterium]